jgi:hypothetical protein
MPYNNNQFWDYTDGDVESEPSAESGDIENTNPKEIVDYLEDYAVLADGTFLKYEDME